jgi:hypothetical protein
VVSDLSEDISDSIKHSAPILYEIDNNLNEKLLTSRILDTIDS